jgi:hypothetical protein|tara:strand:- start:334 stop:1026 length:693 start_codon:yes stop_codon:yes gene_type:complete
MQNYKIIKIHQLMKLVCGTMVLVLLGSGCATNRGILDLNVGVPDNISSGQAVEIVRVTDRRVFQLAPNKPSIPSLKGGEIMDKSITSRAIARKRNGFGKALGDILLPEGKTVEDLTREALTRAFREAGYSVIDNSTESPGNITKIEADIEQFWAWFTPGFWAVKLDFEAKVKITGDIPPFQKSDIVRGHVRLHSQAAGTRAWRNTLNKGIEAFIQEVKKRLSQNRSTRKT